MFLELSSYKRFIDTPSDLTWSTIERCNILHDTQFKIPHHRPHLNVVYCPNSTRLYERYYGPGSETIGDTFTLSVVSRYARNFGRLECNETLTMMPRRPFLGRKHKKFIKISFDINQMTGEITATALYSTSCATELFSESPVVRRNCVRGHWACHKFRGTDAVQLVQRIRDFETTPVDILVSFATTPWIIWNGKVMPWLDTRVQD